MNSPDEKTDQEPRSDQLANKQRRRWSDGSGLRDKTGQWNVAFKCSNQEGLGLGWCKDGSLYTLPPPATSPVWLFWGET